MLQMFALTKQNYHVCSFNVLMTLRGRPFNSWGGGGGGDFEKKFPASACWKKKIACSTNDRKKILALLQVRKKNVAKLFHRGFTKSEQNCNHGWFLMRLHFCIRICLKFFSPGWYVITKGTILPVVCQACFLHAHCSPAKETSVNVLSIRFFG